jgi:septal ring factor EnvC (AmiA/AmiB activator)
VIGVTGRRVADIEGRKADPMSIPERTAGSSRPLAPSPRRTLSQARAGAVEKVEEARHALADLQRRHDLAADRVEAVSRRLAALELELADAERERDQTESRLIATRQALEAAEARLVALNQRD